MYDHSRRMKRFWKSVADAGTAPEDVQGWERQKFSGISPSFLTHDDLKQVHGLNISKKGDSIQRIILDDSRIDKSSPHNIYGQPIALLLEISSVSSIHHVSARD